MARPTWIWALSRALLSLNFVRLVTTSSRKSMKAVRKSFKFSITGRPPLSAIILQPKLVWSWVKRHSWFSTTSATGIAFDFDDDAHAIAVGFIANSRNALDFLFAVEFTELFQQRAFVHLVGDGGDDDRFAVLPGGGLNLRLRPHQHRAASR